MSTEYAVDCDPPLMYDDFIQNPPAGIRIAWRSDSGKPLSDSHARVYVEGVDHVDIRDKCENDMVVRRANAHTVKYHDGIVLGEAIFEQWGLGGWPEHFNEACLAEYGQELYDIVTTLPASDPYHGRCKKCRSTSGETT